jgi:hypothetical protein
MAGVVVVVVVKERIWGIKEKDYKRGKSERRLSVADVLSLYPTQMVYAPAWALVFPIPIFGSLARPISENP